MKLLKHNTVVNRKNLPDASSNTFPGIAVTTSGRIIVSWRNAPQKESLVGQCVQCSISDDGGDSWSEPVYVDSAPFDKFSTPVTGAVSAFSDGEMFVQFELNKPYDSDEEWRHLPVLKFSTDLGKSFVRHAMRQCILPMTHCCWRTAAAV